MPVRSGGDNRLHRPLHGMSYDDSEMSQKVRGNIVFLDRAVGTDDER